MEPELFKELSELLTRWNELAQHAHARAQARREHDAAQGGRLSGHRAPVARTVRCRTDGTGFAGAYLG